MARLDAWMHAGTATRTSLAVYRVLYATVFLLLLPDFTWLANFPDTFFNAPPGPMLAFSSFPPRIFLRGLKAALAVCMVAVLIGWRTRAVSFASVGLGLIGYGFSFSLGKVDHNILFLLAPAALALAGWGDRLSVDALRWRSRSALDLAELAEQWPLRLYALMIGLAFFTAAAPRLVGGWLDPSTMSSRRHR